MTGRMTRRQIVERLTGRTQKSVVLTLDRLERRADNIFARMKSLTSDNGYEFLDIAGIERSALAGGKPQAALYFAHPGSAFERGSNENANRIIRRFVPKGCDIGKFGSRDIRRIEEWINRYPRKILGFKTAEELFALEVGA